MMAGFTPVPEEIPELEDKVWSQEPMASLQPQDGLFVQPPKMPQLCPTAPNALI